MSVRAFPISLTRRSWASFRTGEGVHRRPIGRRFEFRPSRAGTEPIRRCAGIGDPEVPYGDIPLGKGCERQPRPTRWWDGVAVAETVHALARRGDETDLVPLVRQGERSVPGHTTIAIPHHRFVRIKGDERGGVRAEAKTPSRPHEGGLVDLDPPLTVTQRPSQRIGRPVRYVLDSDEFERRRRSHPEEEERRGPNPADLRSRCEGKGGDQQEQHGKHDDRRGPSTHGLGMPGRLKQRSVTLKLRERCTWLRCR